MTNSEDIFSAAAAVDYAEARRWGIGFIDGSIPGYALLIGNNAVAAASLLTDLGRRNILAFVTDETLQAELQASGRPLGWESGAVPLGLPAALGFIARVAQAFGGADETEAALNYARQRLRGFTLLPGEPTPEHLIEAHSALLLGCPLLTTAELPPSVKDWQNMAGRRPAMGGLLLADIVQLGIEECGLQIQIPIPQLPVAYSPDFSGQVVRTENCGACLTGVELTVTGTDIVDGHVTLIGPDLEAIAQGEQPFAMLVEVSGQMMQPDFESVLERQIETILKDTDGVVHKGQRALVTLRISQKSIDKGLRLRHLGEILHARLLSEFGKIISRVQVSFFTEPVQVQAVRERAQAVYEKRDQRLNSLTDEDVDTFYTCNLCQTIAAGHVCVISPEHPGACGAVDWMDARAAVSIRPVGPNKAVKKEALLDAKLGQWESINRIVAQESGGTRTAYSLYSLMQDPGSACGDFECITAMLPLSNGVMVVEHDYNGMTPSGMDWATLYEMVGAGVPVPGFLGHSKRALQREKFIAAEGGWRRIVWMNYSLREELRPVLETLAASAGMTGFVDKITTEQNALSEDEILAQLEASGHPALSMEPMI